MQIRTTGRTFQRLALVAAGICALTTVLSVGGVPASASATNAKRANPSEAAALVAAAGPATAASLLADCPADSVCIYQHRDFLGQLFVTPAGTSRPSLHAFFCRDASGPILRPCDSPTHGNGDGNFGDQMSSWVNNTSLNYCWYFDINFGVGRFFPFPMPAGRSLAFVGSVQDQASSIQPC